MTFGVLCSWVKVVCSILAIKSDRLLISVPECCYRISLLVIGGQLTSHPFSSKWCTREECLKQTICQCLIRLTKSLCNHRIAILSQLTLTLDIDNIDMLIIMMSTLQVLQRWSGGLKNFILMSLPSVSVRFDSGRVHPFFFIHPPLSIYPVPHRTLAV